MRERKTRWGRVLPAMALVVLLFGCVYGRPGYYAGGDPYSGYYPAVDPGVVIGPAAAGIEQLPVVGPMLDALTGGALGYYADYGYEGQYYNDSYYGDPYRNDRSYNDRYYSDPYYNDRYYNDPYYDGRYGYDNRYYGPGDTPYDPYYPR
jgi:hypothetical protein